MDNFDELERIKKLNSKNKAVLGVRIHTKFQKDWKKFGIPLKNLREFFLKAKKMGVNLSGIHFHTSWNLSSDAYTKTLILVRDYLLKNFSKDELKNFKFIDIGGGLDDTDDAQNIFSFFKKINNCIKSNFSENFPKMKILTEPGRWLSNHCFHILLKIFAKKNKKMAILDSGTDNFGFNGYYEKYRFPIINLSHPSKLKKRILLAGSLCSIHDIWGKYIFASKIENEDVILIPFQGAYTYSTANDFIKSFPKVIEI